MAERYAIDSRAVGEGDFFFALPGKKTDGHRFLEEVARRGAKGAYVEASYGGPDFGLVLHRVEDVHRTLAEMARSRLASSKCRVVGVTGSVGKTTTKEFLAHLLGGKFRVAKNRGNANTQITLPLTILNELKPDTEILVLEMGMTEAGNLGKLVSIAPPHLAVVTNVALVHAANFPDLGAIAREKCSICARKETEKVIIPQELMKFLPRKIEAIHPGELPLPELPFPGKHFRLNLMAAAAAALELGVSMEEIKGRIPTLSLPEKRCEPVKKNGVFFINDCYNANAESMIAALELLRESEGRKIAVLGSMLELGRFSEEEHRRVGQKALECADLLFCFGPESRFIGEVWQGRPFEWFGEKGALAKRLQEVLQTGDRVLVKGSNSLKMWELIEGYDRSCGVLR